MMTTDVLDEVCQGEESSIAEKPDEALEVVRLARELSWLVRAGGGIVRSYKRLKAAMAHMDCCFRRGHGITWDGLFFGSWSTRLCEATEWACDKNRRGSDFLTRCYWTARKDPIHTVYLARELDDWELEQAAGRNPEQLAHAVALNLIPWNVPLLWLLMIEAHSREEGDAETKRCLGEAVKVINLPHAGHQAIRAIGAAPLVARVARAEQDRLLYGILECQLDESRIHDIVGAYRSPSFNRHEAITVSEPSFDGNRATVHFKVDPSCVRPTYEYLKLSHECRDMIRELQSIRRFGDAIKLAERTALNGLPMDEASDADRQALEDARERESAYLNRLHRRFPEVSGMALGIAKSISNAVYSSEGWLQVRMEDIFTFIQNLAAFTQTSGEGVPVEWEWYQPSEGGGGIVALPTIDGLPAAVGRERMPQSCMKVHIYHLLQPVEMTRWVVARGSESIMSGDKGGVFFEV